MNCIPKIVRIYTCVHNLEFVVLLFDAISIESNDTHLELRTI